LPRFNEYLQLEIEVEVEDEDEEIKLPSRQLLSASRVGRSRGKGPLILSLIWNRTG
jgi:hypothetical protein